MAKKSVEVSRNSLPTTSPPKAFEELPGTFSETWTPNRIGETKIGLLSSVDVKNVNGDERKILNFFDGKGQAWSLWESARLRLIVEKHALLMGHWFSIKFLGTRQTRKGFKPMKDFDIRIDKAGLDKLLPE